MLQKRALLKKFTWFTRMFLLVRGWGLGTKLQNWTMTGAWERGYWNRLHDFSGCHVEDPGNEANIAGCMNSEMSRGNDLQIIGTHKLRDFQIKNVYTLVLF